MAKTRMHNPKTGKYYSVRQRTTTKGRKGQILGSYKQQAAEKIGKKFGRAISKLGNK